MPNRKKFIIDGYTAYICVDCNEAETMVCSCPEEEGDLDDPDIRYGREDDLY